jgi:phospholipid/cholesterol/gamma-HCH transport system substrate-binding protein
MITKQQKARLSVFTAVSVTLLLVILGALIYPSFRDKGQTYNINFTGTSVNGLDLGAAVKYRGVQVGSVARIRVNPVDLDSILVSIKVIRVFPIKKDMTATLTYAGITGQKFIEISGGSQAAARLPAGGVIPTARGLGEKAEDIVANIDAAVHNLNVLLGEENQKRISQFLANTEQSAAIVSRVLKSKEDNLSRAVVEVEKAAQGFSGAAEDLRTITGNLGRLTAKLEQSAGVALDNLTKRFSDQEMGRVIVNLDGFVGTASSSLKKIEDLLLLQQQDLRHMIESLGAAIENLALFSRALLEDPALLLRSGKKVKK